MKFNDQNKRQQRVDSSESNLTIKYANNFKKHYS